MKHNMNWVSLIMLTDNYVLSGGIFGIATLHADITPIILHLAGICDNNSDLGYSVFAMNENNLEYIVYYGSTALENDDYSFIFVSGSQEQLFDQTDITSVTRYDVRTPRYRFKNAGQWYKQRNSSTLFISIMNSRTEAMACRHASFVASLCLRHTAGLPRYSPSRVRAAFHILKALHFCPSPYGAGGGG